MRTGRAEVSRVAKHRNQWSKKYLSPSLRKIWPRWLSLVSGGLQKPLDTDDRRRISGDADDAIRHDQSLAALVEEYHLADAAAAAGGTVAPRSPAVHDRGFGTKGEVG